MNLLTEKYSLSFITLTEFPAVILFGVKCQDLSL